jgi:mannose-1-phosphate guanylyltransferase
MLHAMIMAGGGGTRFWPRSRRGRPKQFLTLSGGRSLLQQALDRVEAQAPPARCWVITGEAYRDETRRQLPALPPDQVIGEPVGRDTAPCVGLGAALIARADPDAVLLTTPADHVIEPTQRFRDAVHVAVQLADEHPGALITFGVAPTYAAVGYGYIQRGEVLPARQGLTVVRVKQFHEKPDEGTAQRYLESGEYYWNSGIFVWRAATILAALQAHRPALADAVQRIAAAWETPRRDEVLRREYEAIQPISIDKAVLEPAREVLVVQAPYQWDDVGSWLALERLNPQDADRNTVQATHCGLDTRNCVIVGEPGQLIATIGVSDLLIVRDGDAVLVADRRQEAAVKQLVQRLRDRGLEEYL